MDFFVVMFDFCFWMVIREVCIFTYRYIHCIVYVYMYISTFANDCFQGSWFHQKELKRCWCPSRWFMFFRSSFSFHGRTLFGKRITYPTHWFCPENTKTHKVPGFQKGICFLVPWRVNSKKQHPKTDSSHDQLPLGQGLSLTATAVVRGPLDSGDLGDLGFGATATCWWFRNREKAVELGSLFWLFTGFYTCSVVVWDFWSINRMKPGKDYFQDFEGGWDEMMIVKRAAL